MQFSLPKQDGDVPEKAVDFSELRNIPCMGRKRIMMTWWTGAMGNSTQNEGNRNDISHRIN